MGFKRIFDTFSRRAPNAKVRHDIPPTTRSRVLMWCFEIFSNSRATYSSGDHSTEFWGQMHRFLRFKQGSGRLVAGATSPQDDAAAFLLSCGGSDFLDFLEYIFRVDCYFHVGLPEKEVVAELNELLRVDDLPYHVTDFVKEEVREARDGFPPFSGRVGTYVNTLAYPMVIMRDNEAAHAELIVPALELLRNPRLKSANSEYLHALEDYRKDDLGDCLTKCGSALESLMKLICERKGWPYKQTDPASPLLRTILERAKVDSYLEQGLLIGPVIRNKASSAHGAGPQPRRASRQLARYALHCTAAAMLFLATEVGFE